VKEEVVMVLCLCVSDKGEMCRGYGGHTVALVGGSVGV